MSFEISVLAQDDGLPYDEVGSWVEDKHRLVALNNALFSTGMKNKWESRVYIDLYSGSGLARVRDTSKFLWGSPIIALSVKDPFDQYIFCESNRESLDALQRRVGRLFPGASAAFVCGDCNSVVDEVCRYVPIPSRSFRVLSFCFVDPYNLSIKFSTLKTIAQGRFVDFLCLLALEMDANRNREYYLDEGNRKIDNFLGLPDWRTKWVARSRTENIRFPRFLAEVYATQMQGLGYLPLSFDKMKQVRSDVKNLPLYRLALFSRHELAYEYWDEVLKYSTDQQRFWD